MNRRKSALSAVRNGNAHARTVARALVTWGTITEADWDAYNAGGRAADGGVPKRDRPEPTLDEVQQAIRWQISAVHEHERGLRELQRIAEDIRFGREWRR